jgi:Mrp family chromosome partitioning ATPase/predicted Fe-Mo cluster-binding NifX family protein
MAQHTGEYSPMAADHAVNPRNLGRLPHWHGRARITGPCGDTMEFRVQVREGRVYRCAFTTDGCGPSLASGSAAATLAEGRTIDEALAVEQKDVLAFLGGLPADSKHCALLAANTLQAACRDFLQRGSLETGPGATPDLEAANGRREGESDQDFAERRKLEARLGRIRHKVLVLSGKGGVGKSTVAVNMALALQRAGYRVGLLDVDVHGPSVPTMLGLEGEQIFSEGQAFLPVHQEGLRVMSVGFLLHRREDPVIWRGPMKMGVIRQFLQEVEWGDLDYLIVDAPPGTGDEPLSVCQLVGEADGALIVTTPQEVALNAVRKCISFCRKLELRVLGVVENMSGFICPHCGQRTDIFLAGGGRRMAEEMRVAFLGRIPLEPAVALSGDCGRPLSETAVSSEITGAFTAIVEKILDEEPAAVKAGPASKGVSMRIAIPLADGRLSMHFGHCERFALLDVDPAAKTIQAREELVAPAHEPGLLPRWLAERGAQLIIAGGMGARAQQLFAQNGIQVVVGAPAEAPEALASAYLEGTLKSGENVCDH